MLLLKVHFVEDGEVYHRPYHCLTPNRTHRAKEGYVDLDARRGLDPEMVEAIGLKLPCKICNPRSA